MTKAEQEFYIKCLVDFSERLDAVRDMTMDTDWNAFLRFEILWQETREALAFIKALEVVDE